MKNKMILLLGVCVCICQIYLSCKRKDKPLPTFISMNKEKNDLSDDSIPQGLLFDGIREGLYLSYYPNGMVYSAITYKNNKIDGIAISYSEIGFITDWRYYKDDKRHGLAVSFDSFGNIYSKGCYNNGKRIGIWEYYVDGNIDVIVEYRNGKSKILKDNQLEPPLPDGTPRHSYNE